MIRSLDPGDDLTIKDLLTLMIIVSDNTATDLIIDQVGGPDPVNRLMKEWDLKSIRATATPTLVQSVARRARAERSTPEENPFGLSSPRDMGRLLEKLEKGEAVSTDASAQMLQILRGQIYGSRLPRYVSGYRIPPSDQPRFCPTIGVNDVGAPAEDQRQNRS